MQHMANTIIMLASFFYHFYISEVDLTQGSLLEIELAWYTLCPPPY